jgi:hypothetical protein
VHILHDDEVMYSIPMIFTLPYFKWSHEGKDCGDIGGIIPFPGTCKSWRGYLEFVTKIKYRKG